MSPFAHSQETMASAATITPTLPVGNSHTTKSIRIGDVGIIVNPDNLKPLNSTRGLAGLGNREPTIRSLPVGPRRSRLLPAAEVVIALVTRGPARRLAGGDGIARENVQPAAPVPAGGCVCGLVKVEEQLALLAVGDCWVFKRQEGGLVSPPVGRGLENQSGGRGVADGAVGNMVDVEVGRGEDIGPAGGGLGQGRSREVDDGDEYLDHHSVVVINWLFYT